MKIEHLINGATVAGSDYFETVNPATQETLAEVARGGAKEVDAAVAAAKAAFPSWAGKPAVERASALRKLGDLIAQYVPEIAKTETEDTGQVISQTGKQLVPRSADNFYYFAEMCVRVDSHTYPTPTHLNYTSRGLRADLAVERAVHDVDLESRTGTGIRQHRGT
jgi:5-carboxymethyl-2-hydroxymuconic-semialdehyde dehydrogenase